MYSSNSSVPVEPVAKTRGITNLKIQGKAVTDLKRLISMCHLVKSVCSTSRNTCICYGR